MMSEVTKRWLIAVGLLLLLATENRADSEAGVLPYTIETLDKKLVFVMLKGGNREDTYLQKHDKYPQSGMYLNDGSTTPLWTVDWSGYIYFPSDGIHIIRRGVWPRQTDGFGAEAITFFANGKSLKSYSVLDLVDFPWLLRRSVSHYQWQQNVPENDQPKPKYKLLDGDEYDANQGIVIDDKAGTLYLETLNGESYLFDIKTGDIVSSKRPMRRTFLINLVLFLPIYLLYLRRTLVKPDKPLATHLKRISIFAVSIIALVAIASFAIFLTASFLHPSEKNLQTLEAIFTTLIEMPVLLVYSMGEWTREFVKDTFILIIPLFWFVVFSVIGLANLALVKCLRRTKKLAQDNAVEMLDS